MVFLAVGIFITIFLNSCNLETPSLLYATATTTPTITLTSTVTETLTPSPVPSQTPTETITISPTIEPSLTPVPSDTATITDTITPGPSPTASRTATNTLLPSRTLVPSRTRTNTYTPTVTNTPTPPSPGLMFQKPGPLSKISSPINMEVLVSPGEDGFINFTLHGEDGRLISQQVEDYSSAIGRRFWISPSMDFHISGAAETARLTVFTRDLVGRTIALHSVDIILMAVGKDEINPPVVTQDPYLIRYPQPAQVIQGGVLVLSGLARPVNTNPLIFEIIDDSGNLVGSTQVTIAPPSGNLSHMPFVVEIPYSINAPTGARLTIRQESNTRIPGTVALSSMVVLLEP